MSQTSQTALGDIERGNNEDGDQPQSIPNQPSQPSQGESSFGDSSGPLFSMYSRAAEDEDNKMVERWQKDADGIIIFAGLFSAAVAALLAVTVQDLRPNSQDTSSFYLGNIYEVLADPNGTRPSTPSPVAKPPPFSPPRYAVWVNSLWFLSLVMSLSCALLATSLHQWARRYIRLTQPARCSPEKRARMRAFFADGVEKMHIPWVVEGLPTLLHLSLFVFFGGLIIFIFNTDHEVFIFVALWIGLFSVVYGLITLLPLIRHDSPYYSPLSLPVWFLYSSTSYVTFKVLSDYGSYQIWERCRNLRDQYRGWTLGGIEKAAGDTASERSSEIDAHIMDWTVSALGDDDSLEKFFEAIPGFFNSKLVNGFQESRPDHLLERLSEVLHGLLSRTLSSNSITDPVKLRLLDISLNAMYSIRASSVWLLFNRVLYRYWNQVPQTIEMGNIVIRWCSSDEEEIAEHARRIVIRILGTVQELDDRWIELAAQVFRMPEEDIRDNMAHSDDHDSMSLAIFIHVTRHFILSGAPYWKFSVPFGFDICNALPKLQHDFCALWNEIVQEARNHGLDTDASTRPVWFLQSICRPYIALHRGTDAALTAFSLSTESILENPDDQILWQSSSSYPFCTIAGHRQVHETNSGAVSTSTHPCDSPDVTTVPKQAKQANTIAGPPLLSGTTVSENGECSQTPKTTFPAAVFAPPQVSTSSVTTSYPLEGNRQHDIIASCTEPEISQSLSTTSTHAPSSTRAPVAESTSPVLNTSLASYDAGASSASNSLLPASSMIGLSSDPPPPSHVQSLPNTEPLAILTSTTPTPSHMTGDAPKSTVPYPCDRGLINTGNMCFANAVSQMLVHSPPFWNLFRELGNLKAQRVAEGPEAGGGATPLIDSTVRLIEEFMFEKELPPTQQGVRGMPKEDEEKKEHSPMGSLEPTYVYAAMKEKGKLKHFLDGQQQDAEEFFRLYIDTLNDELLPLLSSISDYSSISAIHDVDAPQSGPTGVEDQGFAARPVESPLMRIFGGRFRTTVGAPNQPGTVTTEDWLSLQLDIQHDSVHTVEDALARISHPQPVHLDPTGINEASRKRLIEVLPPVLVIHLKRFVYDPAAGGVIGKSIQFTPELQIPLGMISTFLSPSADGTENPLWLGRPSEGKVMRV